MKEKGRRAECSSGLSSPLSAMLSPLVSCRCSCTWSRSAGRGKTVPATVRTKAPTSTCATPYTTTCGRIHAPPPPAGSREAAAARCPYASTSVWRAQSERVALLQRTAARCPARATAARQRRHCPSVAIAQSRPLRRRHARAPLSHNAGGSSAYPGDAHDETRPAAARARGHSGSAASQSATSAAAARWPAWPARI